MSWKETISASTAVWAGVVDYANERIVDLTHICTSPKSTDQEIRGAQAGIIELQRLISVPQMIAAETQVRAGQGARKEY